MNSTREKALVVFAKRFLKETIMGVFRLIVAAFVAVLLSAPILGAPPQTIHYQG